MVCFSGCTLGGLCTYNNSRYIYIYTYIYIGFDTQMWQNLLTAMSCIGLIIVLMLIQPQTQSFAIHVNIPLQVCSLLWFNVWFLVRVLVKLETTLPFPTSFNLKMIIFVWD